MHTFGEQAEIDIETSEDSSSFSDDQKRLARYIVISTLAHAAVWSFLLFFQSSGSVNNNAQIVNVNISGISNPETEHKLTSRELIPDNAAEAEDELTNIAETDEEPPRSESTDQIQPVNDTTPNIVNSISFGSFASLGDGLSLKDELRPYFLDMLQSANRTWNTESGGKKLWRGAMLLITIERSGKVTDVRILESSGNSLNDKLLVSALKKGSYSPLPDSYTKETFEAPIRFNPPLSLLSLDSFFSKPPVH